jgi:hypothetical protein
MLISRDQKENIGKLKLPERSCVRFPDRSVFVTLKQRYRRTALEAKFHVSKRRLQKRRPRPTQATVCTISDEDDFCSSGNKP